MNSANIEKIRRIKSENTKKWLALDGVVAIGIGKVSSGEPGLIISVKNNLEKVRSEIPGKIDDVIIEIQQSGPIKAF